MKIGEYFLHFFTPRHTNNHKARALHAVSISSYITALLVLQIFLTALARVSPGVLGYASNITVVDLLRYTNERRITAGQERVELNTELSEAATAKARDMFSRQYWAHSSPDGQDPWLFITGAGYNYLFAGENLARDFGDSRAVVEAWIKSASHRDNLLSPRYKDVGFAVVNGKYNGYETTLVVQMFGAKTASVPTVVPASGAVKAVLPAKTVSGGVSLPKIDIFTLTKNLSSGLVVVLAGVLVIDSVLVYQRRAVRLSGHNLAHLLFLLAILAALNLIGRGVVL